LFTKEIQHALLDQRCDLAVHSLKDLPTDPVAGLRLAAVPPREDVRDALVCQAPLSLKTLPHAAVVGTGSIRRAAQLRAIRPDLQVRDIRGNLDTRLAKQASGQYDAIVLAYAGLRRLGWQDRIAEVLSVDWMLPAVGQAALGLEIREDDHRTAQAVAHLQDEATWSAVVAERALLQALRAGCLAPVAALAQVDGDRVRLRAAVLTADGSRRVTTTIEGPKDHPQNVGQTAARALVLAGASEIIHGE
jgi:hydroxymethylbilane synthase